MENQLICPDCGDYINPIHRICYCGYKLSSSLRIQKTEIIHHIDSRISPEIYEREREEFAIRIAKGEKAYAIFKEKVKKWTNSPRFIRNTLSRPILSL